MPACNARTLTSKWAPGDCEVQYASNMRIIYNFIWLNKMRDTKPRGLLLAFRWVQAATHFYRKFRKMHTNFQINVTNFFSADEADFERRHILNFDDP